MFRTHAITIGTIYQTLKRRKKPWELVDVILLSTNDEAKCETRTKKLGTYIGKRFYYL